MQQLHLERRSYSIERSGLGVGQVHEHELICWDSCIAWLELGHLERN